MFNISFPNGKSVEYDKSIKCVDLLNFLDCKGKKVVGLKVNNEVFSLNRSVDVDSHV